MRDRKILFVTGSSSDIGMALIRNIVDEYDFIWAHYNRSVDRLNELREELGEKLCPVQADFGSEDSVKELIKCILDSNHYPDHIVHLAAPKTFNQRFHKCNWNDYQNGIDTSLKSIVLILEALIPKMIKNKYGKIVFMLTSYVVGVPPKYQSPYITVKYALYGLMRNLAFEYAEKGIMVNGISPDMIETRFLEDIPEIVVMQNAEKNPLKRNLMVGDVVPAFQYLLSDGADAVTGMNLSITGGVR